MFVKIFRWVCSRSGKKKTENGKMERRKQKVNKRQLPTGSKQVNWATPIAYWLSFGR